MTAIDTAPLFGPLHAELLALLRGLSADDWQRPTVAGRWLVRDVAAMNRVESAGATIAVRAVRSLNTSHSIAPTSIAPVDTAFMKR